LLRIWDKFLRAHGKYLTISGIDVKVEIGGC
jgi:hypothetical protein